MQDPMTGNNMVSFLLKECYALAALHESNSSVQAILHSKECGIALPDNYSPDEIGVPHPNTIQQATSDIMLALSAEGSFTSQSGTPALQEMISSMPDSGDREFLLAILALRGGRSETQQLEALRHVQRARSFSLSDPRFLALAEILQQIKR